MKQIKALTDFGIQDVKIIGKPKNIKGDNYAVCEIPYKYMNSSDVSFIRQVIHVKSGCSMPIRGMHHKAPAKDYLNEVEYFLSKLTDEQIQTELSKLTTINQ